VCFAIGVVSLYPPPLTVSQNTPAKDSGSTSDRPGETLKRIVTGHGELSGSLMIFRVYEAADGTTGRITYVKFPTLKEAKRQIDNWLKLSAKAISRDYDIKRGNIFISDRILAQGDDKEFLIIRRNGLICYFVHSPSLQTAMRIEDTID